MECFGPYSEYSHLNVLALFPLTGLMLNSLTRSDFSFNGAPFTILLSISIKSVFFNVFPVTVRQIDID